MQLPRLATIKRFISVVRPFFYGDMRWRARGLLLLLFCFSISVSWFNVYMSYINRDFMTAFAARQEEDFTKNLYLYLIAFAGATVLVVFYRYTEERLGLMWRRWLSIHILKKYFHNKAYYHIGFFSDIDNPDQRIEEDIRTFCGVTLSFTLIFCNSLIAISAFISILWSISIPLTLVAVGYSLGGSVIAYFLGRPLINLNFAQLKKDADYRYKLINVRDNSESIAFLSGENKELSRVRQKLKVVLDNMLAIIDWNRNLSFFVTPYNYLIGILPIVVVAPLYLRGEVEFGVVTQAQVAFGQVLGALSIVVTNFGSISNFAAVIRRLGTFVETLDEIGTGEGLEIPRNIKTIISSEIAVKDVTILTPSGDRKVLENLSFSGIDRLLVRGPSGSGKSSLLRVLSGVWNYGEGLVYRPAYDEVMFLPQRPYISLGSFRGQFLYPVNWKGLRDEEIIAAIEEVGLTETLQRVGGLDAVHNWGQMLSVGEQQMISITRFLLSQRRYAFLDEATTALDGEAEERLYALISKHCRSIVSVGYSEILKKYHTHTLQLIGAGKWKLMEIKK